MDKEIDALFGDVSRILGELQEVQDKDIEADFEYIRNYYGVPAHIGVCIEYSGGDKLMDGIIVSARGQYIIAILDDGHEYTFHPTWRLRYLESNGAVVEEVE